MIKVVCDNCKTTNKIAKKAEFFYCNSCGKKIKVDKSIKSIKGSKIKIIISVIVLLILAVLFVIIPVRQYGSEIKTSELKDYCKVSVSCKLNDVIEKHFFSIVNYKIKNDVVYSTINEKYLVTIEQFGKEKEYEFTLKDDLAPYIEQDSIELPIEKELSLEGKIQVHDFVDGEIPIDSSNIKIDTSKVDTTKEGTYYIDLELKDSVGNTSKKRIKADVKKILPQKVTINLNDKYVIKKDIALTGTVEPADTYDKSLKWYYTTDYDPIEKKNISGNKIKFNHAGHYRICAQSSMKNDVFSCKEVAVKNDCPSQYVFKYDGGTTSTIEIGEYEDVCPGTYRITIATMNKSSSSVLTIYYGDNLNIDMIDTYNPYYSGNGSKYVLHDDVWLTITPGVTKVTLKKVK